MKTPALDAPDFQSALFARVAAEDLAAFDAESLRRIGQMGEMRLSETRKPGNEAISLTDINIKHEGRQRELACLIVVNDNMPFLLDSTLAELVEQNVQTLLVVHPILAVERQADGTFVRFAGEAAAAAPQGTRRESLILIVLERLATPEANANLIDALKRVYLDVRRAVDDWAPMRGRLAAAVLAYRANPPPLPAEDVAEALAFLEWLGAENFSFLGLRDYRYPDGDAAADPVEGSGLGIMRDPAMRILRRGRELVTVTPEVRAFLQRPAPLIITKANVKSRVHRRVHLDYIGLKLFSAEGRLEGEMRIIGLFTANAYTGSTAQIPYLRHKVATVMKRAGYDLASHSGRALMNVLENYPRDELFQVDVETLYVFAIETMKLYERPRVRVLVRPDTFDRFVSILAYIPKDRYDTSVRRRVGEYLAAIYKGVVSAAYPTYPEGPLARTHYIIGRYEGETPKVDRAEIERGIGDIVRTWADGLRDALAEQVGESAETRRITSLYADAFGPAYRDTFSARDAIRDIRFLESLSEERPQAVDLYRQSNEADDLSRAHLKVFSRGAALSLSMRVPVLENLGFRVLNERTFRVDLAQGTTVWLHDMLLERATGKPIDIPAIEGQLEAALLAVFSGAAESDGFNALVLEGGMTWREVALVRAMARFLRQARIPFSQDYMWTTLVRHADIARALVDLFAARFDPKADATKSAQREKEILATIETGLSTVTVLDEDRIIRRFVNLLQAMLRTNYYQRDGNRAEIAFKLDCRKIDDLPAPRPLYEIFVYSPRVEGVHLRFGKVARGGLRWSDRPQDFRTEVLGLVKAQQVKNAVIVPVGAKGGFLPKRLPQGGPREAIQAEGVAAYKIFVSTLLTLTDNLVQEKVVPPADTIRHDPDDPYLVVAADKGTATFSDLANSISAEHGYWLGDAFASGGSAGYDHKGMAITARGAWEAVKRHFREIDHDIQSTPFTVAGIGDMSGDVFGNGMLLSRKTRLIAAFDHRDIFIDPDPDPEISFAERKRLFALPRSSWQDYDKALISKGGGVFSRALKAIPLSPEARAAIQFDKREATPAELMHAILRAPVDLLWFGGIGTYIKASDETDEQVGDRANDAIRVTSAQLRCKVIGEGANLGATQRGRIEAARRGIRLNTDAIDNSAGVNTSDLEVNIKIALTKPEADGRLGKAERKALLAAMTDEVASLVLRNNYLQSLALSLAVQRGVDDVAYVRKFMQRLEREGRLDRAVEFLPEDAQLAERERRGEGLTRPELAVLLAYAKLSLHDMLLASRVPDDPYLSGELQRYFPAPIRERFPDAVAEHRLRREIVATQLANAIINRGGPTIVERVAARTGAGATEIAAAYALARDGFGLLDINLAIDRLDNKIAGKTQLALYGLVQDALIGALTWFARRIGDTTDLSPMVESYRGGIAEIRTLLTALLPEAERAARSRQIAGFTESGVPLDLAEAIADLDPLTAAPDVVDIASKLKRPIRDVATAHYMLRGFLRLDQVMAQARTVPVADDYERLARDRAIDAIAEAHRRATTDVMNHYAKSENAASLWLQANDGKATRIRSELEAMAASGMSLAKVVVAASLVNELVAT